MAMQGVRANYLDDELLAAKLDQYDTLILPPTPLLSQEAAVKIAAFVQAGGKLILVGAAGQFDPWLNPQAPLGGKAWQSLGWKAPDYKHQPIRKGSRLLGVNLGQLTHSQTIRDSQGKTIGWQKHWGKGQVFAMGVYPNFSSSNPHPPVDAEQWMKNIIKI
ncbi:MAG: beta-galactosidase trimerization domain-containing protein, partial [Phycisphaeraceae bacterium]|nr:beta-galactosidase trimerization domain-containing protein [Phycisphaeraceae bacterium]